MAAHFAAQSIVRRQADASPASEESSAVFPDMALFHPGGEGLTSGRSRASQQADYKAGFDAGKAEATQMYEQTIRVMEDALEALKSSIGQLKQDVESSHGEVVKQCLHALLPDLAQQILRQEIENVLTEAAKSHAASELLVSVHPDNDIGKSFLLKSFEKSISVVENADLDINAVHFSWGSSTSEIDPIKTAQTCLTLLGVSRDQDLTHRKNKDEALGEEILSSEYSQSLQDAS